MGIRAVNIYALAISLSVLGCSEVHEGASENEIRDRLALDLPTGIEVADVEIIASENVGSEVEPIYRSRANVTLRYAQDFYAPTDEYNLDDAIMVRELAEEGDELDGDVIAMAILSGRDQWDISIERRNFPTIFGEAESTFGVSKLLIEGTSAYNRAKREQDAFLEKEQREFVAKTEKLKSAFSGQWKSTEPVKYDDRVWKGRDNLTVGYSIRLVRAEDYIGYGEVRMYPFERPSDFVKAELEYELNVPAENISLKFGRSKRHKSLGTFINTSTWEMKLNGSMTQPKGKLTARVSK